MTEGAAKLKWCHRTFNRREGLGNCVASQCMAWRWRSSGWDLGREFPKVPQNELDKMPSGYCGLVEKDR